MTDQVIIAPTIKRVLDYWFADIGDSFDTKPHHKRWFGGSGVVDQQIRTQFLAQVEQALAGELSHWAETAEGMLALTILLDQFTRNIYRGTGKAFAGDNSAQVLVRQGLQCGIDQQLSIIQRTFFYMPLMHAEDLAAQQQCMECFKQLQESAPAAGKATIQSNLDSAERHLRIIEQFGRFPYRNAALGRESTATELAYLSRGGARFGQ